MNNINIDLDAIKNIDITRIDPSTLVDIQNVKIDTTLPKEERMKQYLNQTNGNPYFFMCDGIVVKVSYSETDLTINDGLESYISSL